MMNNYDLLMGLKVIAFIPLLVLEYRLIGGAVVAFIIYKQEKNDNDDN